MRDNRSYFLGHVVAGSGVYWIQKNDAEQATSMDWALVDIALGRLQRQMHGDEVEGNRPFNYDPTRIILPSKFWFNPQLQAHPSMKLYKTGRSSGTTSGLYNGLMSVDICRQRARDGGSEKIITWVHSVFSSSSQAFAERGGFWFMGVYGVRRRLRDVDHRRRTEGNSEHMLHI